MDIFDLDGPKGSYKGRGSSDGEPETTGNFPLKQGLVVLRIGHEGDGRIDLMLVSVKTPSGGRTEGDRRATAPTTGTTGRVFGGLLGAARAAGSLANEIFGAGIWATEGLTGQFDNVIDILRIADDSNADLKPGDYQLEVKSEARWTCEFIQPNVGQSTRKLSDEDDEGAMDELVEPGVYVLSPMTSGEEAHDCQHKARRCRRLFHRGLQRGRDPSL